MGVQADSVSFDETRLERAIFTDARLQRLSFRDSLLTSCDFSMVRSAHGSWHRVVIQKGRMTGWDTSASVLQDVHFKHCKLDLINMRFSKLTRVLFEDCVLTGADFSNATLVQVVFDGCQLDQAEFSQVSLEKVDMRGSELIGLRGWRFLKGAIIDDVQLQSIAPYLAAEIGLQVKE